MKDTGAPGSRLGRRATSDTPGVDARRWSVLVGP